MKNIHFRQHDNKQDQRYIAPPRVSALEIPDDLADIGS